MTDNRTTDRVDHSPRVRDAIDELMRKKDATDNRTTELESLSKLKKAGKLRYWRGTIEMPETELHAICDEIQAEHEQAIAATLGSERESGTSATRLVERLRSIADEMRNVGASTMTPHELLAFYAREVDKVADSLKFVAELRSEREKVLEDLVRSLYADYYSEWPDRAEEAYTERMKELGIEVVDE